MINIKRDDTEYTVSRNSYEIYFKKIGFEEVKGTAPKEESKKEEPKTEPEIIESKKEKKGKKAGDK